MCVYEANSFIRLKSFLIESEIPNKQNIFKRHSKSNLFNLFHDKIQELTKSVL